MTARDTVALSSLTERVGDAERDALMSELNGHHAHGRLTADDLDRRLGLALTAVTRYDLLVLVSDLPASDREVRRAPDTARRARRRELRRAALRTSVRGVAVSAPVLGAGWFIGMATQYGSGPEVGFWATVIGGTIGWTTHAARGWIIDHRADGR